MEHVSDEWSTMNYPPLDWTQLDAARRELAAAGYGYGSWQRFEKERDTHYPALKGTRYLDYAASAPALPAAVQAFAADVTSNLFSNPHSRSTSSSATAHAIDEVRQRVLTELCGLSDGQSHDWDVIFTSGATASIKLVGDALAWRTGGDSPSKLSYLTQSHTSLVGLRGIAIAHGAEVEALEAADLAEHPLDNADHKQFLHLAAYPAQCNVTGTRLGLELCHRIKQRSGSTVVLLDAAAYMSTSVLALGSVPYDFAPDFIACSFYKMFGWPTGLGALIVKRSSSHLLQNQAYFGGGTVSGLSIHAPFWDHRRHAFDVESRSTSHTELEHGTLPFLEIISLKHAMDAHASLYTSQAAVSAHAQAVRAFASAQLLSLRHANGQPVVTQHTSPSCTSLHLERPGPVIGFSLLNAQGDYIGHTQLEKLAVLQGFQIRTGGMCNTGAWTSAVGVTNEDLGRLRDQGRACWDDEEFYLGKPLGLARISFGASSTLDDVAAFIDFLRRYFVDPGIVDSAAQDVNKAADKPVVKLEKLTLYPIKSCAGQSVPSWPITPAGLAHDREFMLVDPRTNAAISQKRLPRMVLIRPRIDVDQSVMLVSAPGMQDLVLSLDDAASTDGVACASARVCSDTVEASHVSRDADEWFSTFLDTPCELRRHQSTAGTGRHAHFNGPPQPLLLSNESPFLLISAASTRRVNEWISLDSDEDVGAQLKPVLSACFRANFELSDDLPPFSEDEFGLICIGEAFFQVLGPCRRCLMVSIDQDSGVRIKEPFSTLARHRKGPRGRIDFGVHLIWREDLSSGSRLRTGDSVRFLDS